MTLPLINNQEGGTAGAVVTPASTGNSGGSSGSFFNGVNGSVIFSPDHPGAGMLGFKGTQDATVAGQAKVSWSVNSLGTLSSVTVYTRLYIYLPALPAAGQTFHSLVSAASGVAWALRIDTAGHLLILDQGGATIYTSTQVLPTAALIRMETQSFIHATTGHILAKVYYDDGSGRSAQGTTEVFSLGSATTNQTLRGTVDNANFGLITSGTGYSLYFSDMELNATSWPGPSALSVPPDWYRISGGTWGSTGQVKHLSGGAWA